MQKVIVLFIFLFILSGCARFTQYPLPPDNPVNHYLPWAKRKSQLSALQNWKANGNLAIHSTTGSGVNASFSWEQMKTSYSLNLFGPLGSQNIQLIGNPKQVSLLTHHQTYTAQNADRLLQQQVGLYLPVSQLYYWLRGLPAPEARYTVNLDAYNRLLKLRQSGWHIHYNHYTNLGSLDIPDRIELSNSHWQVRILINHWDLQ